MSRRTSRRSLHLRVARPEEEVAVVALAGDHRERVSELHHREREVFFRRRLPGQPVVPRPTFAAVRAARTAIGTLGALGTLGRTLALRLILVEVEAPRGRDARDILGDPPREAAGGKRAVERRREPGQVDGVADGLQAVGNHVEWRGR